MFDEFQKNALDHIFEFLKGDTWEILSQYDSFANKNPQKMGVFDYFLAYEGLTCIENVKS